MPTEREVLIAARKLIEEPEHWTRGAFARDARGHGVAAIDSDAFCFCAEGALRRAYDGSHWDPEFTGARKILSQAANELLTERGLDDVRDPESEECAVALYNDSEQIMHADVLALFDRAIARAGA